MNLTIYCQDLREQILVLRKLQKLEPDVKWQFGEQLLLRFIPGVDTRNNMEVFFSIKSNIVTWNNGWNPHYIPAYDFLEDDWKPEPETDQIIKSIQEQINSLQNQLNQLISKP